MKKIMFLGGLLLSAMTFVACTDEYDDWAEPQSNPQEETAAALPGYTATGVATVIDLETITDDSVQIISLSSAQLPEGATLGNIRVEFTEGATSMTVDLDNEGKASKADIQSLIETLYGKAVETRTLNGHVYANVIIGGQTFLVDAGTVSVQAIPELVFADYYYIIGLLNNWDTSSTDVPMYRDAEGVYSYTTQWTSEVSPYGIKFTADYNLGGWDGAYGNGDYGVLSDDGGAGNLQQPTTGDYYTLTVDLNPTAMSYTWTRLDAPASYSTIGILGDFNSWGDDVNMTEVVPHNWFVETTLTAGAFKFRADDDWADSWGQGEGSPDERYGTAVYNAGNMQVSDGTYRIFFNDITGQYIFIPVE